MTSVKRYACDLCKDEIREPTDGIGIRWHTDNAIRHVFLTDSEHHLCNRCIEGLRVMFQEIAATQEMYRKLDADSASETAG
jgi:hypothetical protein